MSVGPRPGGDRPPPYRETTLQTFSPREVQARVRAGESAEAIAADTGWALDKVTRYAEPLLAERAYIAEQAQSVEVRRSGGGATLREATDAATDGAQVEWDAYRREDGRWVVTAQYGDARDVHVATWTYDHAGRNLHPQDDEARALMGARPVAVPADDLDEADIADALNLVAPIPVVRGEAEPARPHLVAVPDADEEQPSPDEPADEPTPLSSAHPTVALPAPKTPAKTTRSTTRSTRAKRGSKTVTAVPAESPEPAEPDEEPAASTTPKPTTATAPRKPRTRKGRASVPTWDEILFGSGKPSDDDA